MRAVEMIFIREVLREFCEEMGYDQKNSIVPHLVTLAVPKDLASSYMKAHTTGGSRDDKVSIALAGLRIINDKSKELFDYLERNGERATATYLYELIDRYLGPSGKVDRPGLANEIFRRWNTHRLTGDAYLKSGIYQIFRRFKPRNPDGPERDTPSQPDPDDILIVELLYLDTAAMEGFIVTSEGNIFWGTAHLNDDGMLTLILQRPSRVGVELKHRFVAIHAKHRDENTPDIYSGLYLKAGDKTKRPLAGEAIFRLMGLQNHPALHAKLSAIFAERYGHKTVSDDPEIMTYIAAYDGESAPQARLAEVPFIEQLSKTAAGNVVLLGLPIRTTDAEALLKLRGSKKYRNFEAYKRDPGPDLAK